jgi:hypothetical protein
MSQHATDKPTGREHALKLINTEVTASLERQAEASRNLDTKAVLMVGYAGAAAAFLATRHPQHVLGVLAYAGYAASAASGTLAYAVRIRQDVPAPRRLFNGYYDKPAADTLAALAATRVQAFEMNARKHSRKVALWWTSLASLAAGMILMIAALTSAYW